MGGLLGRTAWHWASSEVQTGVTFNRWFKSIRDKATKARLQVRIDRIEQGNYGDYKAVGSGVFEARITFGAGYRIYFIENGLEVVILLAGGNKSTQSKDIQTAVQIANEIRGTL